MLIKYEEELQIFLMWRGVPDTQNIIWHNTNYVRKNNVFSYHIVVSAV